MVKYCYVQLTIEFNKSFVRAQLYTSVWLIDETLTGTTTLGQSGPRSNGNV